MKATDPLCCPKCRALNWPPLSNAGLTCLACNTVFPKNERTHFLDFRATAGAKVKQERSLLEHQAHDFYSGSAFKDFTLSANTSMLKTVLREIKPRYMADIGCGAGGFAVELKDFYDFYIGFDPSDIPEGLEIPHKDFQKTIFIQNDVGTSYPLANNSIDTITLFASYDHIPNPETVVGDLWKKLAPGGHLLVNMTNYGFWLKRTLNKLLGREVFKQSHSHYCVHSPKTLVKEVLGYLPNAKVVRIEGDYRMIPNLPKKLRFFYAHPALVVTWNKLFQLVINHILRIKGVGADMIVVFQKTA